MASELLCSLWPLCYLCHSAELSQNIKVAAIMTHFFGLFVDRVRDEDTESGKGLSLPQSPHSLSSTNAVRNSSGPRSVDSDFEDSHRDFRTLPDVAISLCGHFGGDGMEPPEELFLQSMVTYDDFVENPRLIENPDLLVRIAGKYYTWQAACPIIMSWALYQRVLPPSTMDIIVNEYGPKRDLEKEKEKKKTLPEAQPTRSWFPWGRSKKTSTADGSTIHQEAPPNPNTAPDSPKSPAVEMKLTQTINSPSTGEHGTTGTSSDNESNDSIRHDTSKKMPLERRSYYDNTDVYCKTLRLNSEQIVIDLY
jgi:phosphatidate phosphatase LPIN